MPGNRGSGQHAHQFPGISQVRLVGCGALPRDPSPTQGHGMRNQKTIAAAAMTAALAGGALIGSTLGNPLASGAESGAAATTTTTAPSTSGSTDPAGKPDGDRHG